MPTRSGGMVLNMANLTARPSKEYYLGPGDILEVTISDLDSKADRRPFRVTVMGTGEVFLPYVGAVNVTGLNEAAAIHHITSKYVDGILVNPQVNLALVQEATIHVNVLGEVNKPGMVELPKGKNDVGSAISAAGGLSDLAAEMIEVHRRLPDMPEGFIPERLPFQYEQYDENPMDPKKILRIPLRGLPPGALQEQDVVLGSGDFVVVPSRRYDVFWVVGKLSETNLVRFSLGDRERELGAGLVLPRDRDIDVVTAVAMASYIDPIDSPTTVTVQRNYPGCDPLLIKVDHIKARFDRTETVLVQPGDIIYLNPDSRWWMRRTFDRIVPDILLNPYSNWLSRSIIGPRGAAN